MGDVAANRSDGVVAAGDIARLANVGRAAVSNWRRRYSDFPEPVGGTSTSPVFALAEVEAWLTRHGKQFRVLLGDRIWQRVRTTVDDLRLGDLVSYLGLFLVFHQREPDRWTELADAPDPVLATSLPRAVAAVVPELPGSLPERFDDEAVDIIRSIAELAAEQGHVAALDFLWERYLEAHSRRLPVTSPEVAALTAALVEPAGSTVLDPACGFGTLLLAAHTAGAARLLGQDTSDTAARLSAARLLVRGASAEVAVDDSLRADAFSGELVDAVVCNPPFNERSWGYKELTNDPRWEYGLPPRGEPELAWAQHCLAHVRPGGEVVIMMPATAASRRPGKRIRANLLRSGALRAVISLPSTVTSAASPPDLWVLRRPCPGDRAPSRLLVVDTTEDLSVAQPAWRSFLADLEQEPPGPSRSVPIVDLLDDEVDISPGRYLTPPGHAGPTEGFPPKRAALLSASTALAATLPDLVTSDEPRDLPMTTIGELAKAGLVVVHQAPLRMTTDAGDAPVLTASDVRRGRPASGRTTAEPGCVVVEPGDVVVAVVSAEASVRVLTEGGAVLGPRLVLFRADQERIDPHFLAGCIRAAGISGAIRASSSSMRMDARRTRVPRLPLDEQRRYGEMFQRLIAFEDALRRTVSLGEDLVRLGFAGLTDGGLRPGEGGPRSA